MIVCGKPPCGWFCVKGHGHAGRCKRISFEQDRDADPVLETYQYLASEYARLAMAARAVLCTRSDPSNQRCSQYGCEDWATHTREGSEEYYYFCPAHASDQDEDSVAEMRMPHTDALHELAAALEPKRKR